MPDATTTATSEESTGLASAAIDSSKAHPARIYDYFLGGKDNFPADREAAETALRAVPEARAMARANRAFLGRAVRQLAEAGITQFLDIGTGIPSPGNTGAVAREIHPAARVVYVDYDPIVAAHSRALLSGADPALTAVVQADIREPASILGHDAVRTVLDFEQPVGVLMVAVLHFVQDADDPAALVAAFRDAVVPGSHLVISHGTDDFETERAQAGTRGWNNASSQIVLRSHATVSGLFDGLELLDPGVVQLPWWRPDAEVAADASRIWLYGGVGVKG